jgi:thioredoxin-like negative regulator of GroEL
MIERIIIVLVLIAAGLIVYRVLTGQQLAQARRQTRENRAVDPLLAQTTPGTPTIVYFTTPNCAPCRLQQTPTLQRLQSELADRMQVVRVDASEQPEIAERWGVFSVPTIFVLGPDGQPRSVHNGVVDSETLKRALLA